MMVSALARPVELSRQPAVARRELAGLLARSRWDGDVDGVILAVHEAMVNAQRHGGGVTKATAGIDGDRVVVEVSDRGHGFEMPESPAMADVAAERGRGLLLIRRLSDDARVVRTGPEVRLVLKFDR
jgi:anti-sigma regulatory factor (Ser/Thr protein kinase)